MRLINVTVPIVFLLLCLNAFGQNTNAKDLKNATKKNRVKLIDWKAVECDHTFDPYRLMDRITALEIQDGRTLITVNFSENCCAEFKPSVQFKKNKLSLQPFDDLSNLCGCECCFSIQFEIGGLPESGYNVYFKGKKIEQSDDYYELFEPSQEEYNGMVINRRNKYGFSEGTWITFYEDGKHKEVRQYSEHELYGESEPIFTKQFYPSGSLSFFSRKDTTESWFEDGQLKSLFIKYKHGDTTYHYDSRKYENRQLKKKELDRTYPTIFTSEFDPDYKGKGSNMETVYKEEYFESGQPKFIHGKDTSYSWYVTGQIESKRYDKGEISYDINGTVTQRTYSWKQKGPHARGDLDHSLDVNFDTKGNVYKIRYVRDEEAENGIAMGQDYNWAWSIERKLVEAPENWKGVFPWERFPEIEIP